MCMAIEDIDGDLIEPGWEFERLHSCGRVALQREIRAYQSLLSNIVGVMSMTDLPQHKGVQAVLVRCDELLEMLIEVDCQQCG